MESKVFFIDFRTTARENIYGKLDRLFDQSGLSEVFTERELVAVKLHFGELGNTAFIRPLYLRRIVEYIKNKGGSPFLTDSNTLYAGTRSDSPSHMKTAVQNGFAYSVVDAPVIIADGLRGKSETAVKIDQKNFKKAYIASEIEAADSLVSVAHFKGHELSGFGGTLKNLGMGCASRKGKLAQHSTVAPFVKQKKCEGCNDCLAHCSQNAITITDEKAKINGKKCIGCGECILICPNEAVQIKWDQSVPIFLENLVEYTYGVLKNKKGKTLYFNFITDVSPACDCINYSDSPIVRDIGIVASTDPVAIDQASVDLVNGEAALPNTSLKTNREAGEDKFKGLYSYVDWEIQLDYSEKIGLGKRKYDLVNIESLEWGKKK